MSAFVTINSTPAVCKSRRRRDVAVPTPESKGGLARGLRPTHQVFRFAQSAMTSSSLSGTSVYIVRCADASPYIGETDNVDNRIARHQEGRTPVPTPQPDVPSNWFALCGQRLAANRVRWSYCPGRHVIDGQERTPMGVRESTLNRLEGYRGRLRACSPRVSSGVRHATTAEPRDRCSSSRETSVVP